MFVLVFCISSISVAVDISAQINLQPDEVAILGYGSLISVASFEKTLGRKYEAPTKVVHLMGWKRVWTAQAPNINGVRVLDTNQKEITPKNLLYLNIQPDPESSINGVLLIIKKSELAAFDQREWIYNRYQINDHILGAQVVNGPVYVYVAKPEYTASSTEPNMSDSLILASYIKKIQEGLRSHNQEYNQKFQQTTEGVNQKLIGQDLIESYSHQCFILFK